MWRNILRSNDSKSLWSHINWNGKSEAIADTPDIDDLKNHFKQKGKSNEESTLLHEVTGNVCVPDLDDNITLGDVYGAYTRLKPGRATGDAWVKNMIPSFHVFFMTFLMTIMNTIFVNHLYPTQCRQTIINALYKFKDKRDNALNFRPISLVQLLSKLFDFILLKRFTKWFKPHDAQTAYQEGRSSADHVFFMRCMIQYARKCKQELFLIAIDFDGAFDRVSRSTLIKKLTLFGDGTIFTFCVASIYMSTENIIFQGNEHRTYSLSADIKQGLPLSPMIFLFYINDIFQFFDAIYIGGTSLLGRINILIHADDATLIATTRAKATAK